MFTCYITRWSTHTPVHSRGLDVAMAGWDQIRDNRAVVEIIIGKNVGVITGK